MAREKQYVFSARTTEEGLRLLNQFKTEKGIGWGFININSIVIVWEMAPTSKKIGTYTGVYYFFSFMAAILGPFMVGSLTDALGNTYLFIVCSFFFIAALVFMFLVRRGEAALTEEEERAKKAAIQEL